MNAYILSREFQSKWKSNNLVDKHLKNDLINNNIKVHNEIDNPLSSQASCVNFWCPFIDPRNKNYLKDLLLVIGIDVDEIITIKSGSYFGGYKYLDGGNVIFEWIGPKKSPINENGNGRGMLRTSIDAYILARKNRQNIQILIEWKFTESYSSKQSTGKFLGSKGLERFSRYAPILAKDRKSKDRLLLDLSLLSDWGMSDLGYEVFYQLLRQHLLAKQTIGMTFGSYKIHDYRVVHLSHSGNNKLNILNSKVLEYSDNIAKYVGKELHDVWPQLLSEKHRSKFIGAYWDEVFKKYQPPQELEFWYWQNYINERYVSKELTF